jgi:hypothetical protein
MHYQRLQIVLVADSQWVQSARRLLFSLQRLGDCSILTGSQFLKRAVQLDRSSIVLLLGDVPGASVLRAIGCKGTRFGAEWFVRGRMVSIGPALSGSPRPTELDGWLDELEEELDRSWAGERLFQENWASTAPYCASVFLDEGISDPKEEPPVPLEALAQLKQQWFHMGVASFIGFELSTVAGPSLKAHPPRCGSGCNCWGQLENSMSH